ncbi:WXG100 family type VII secretion target [Nocardia sp. NPDC003963]
MAGEVTTDFAAMDTAAKHVETVNGSLANELGNVRSLVAGTHGNWKGAAAGTFRKVMDDYDFQSKQLHDVLVEISELIRQNGKGYTATEQENQDAINRAGASGDLGTGFPDSSLKI